jgi:hypothetical protein
MYFEWGYRRSRTRLKDLAVDYNIHKRTARRIILAKLQMVNRARSRWPAYATHEEDRHFRNKKWDDHFGEVTRVVMHDNTNVPMPDPTDADLSRSCYSKYYGECCTKGGSALQLRGWSRGIGLCPGNVPDSAYIDLVEILAEQQLFALWDKTSIEGFLNIFDKGGTGAHLPH